MIFRFLGKTAQHAWPLLLAAWILLLLGTWYAAPPWSEVALSREFPFLPDNAPSRRAEELFAEAFPDDQLGSSVVLVIRRADNDSSHRAEDLRFVDDELEPGLRQIADSEGGLASDRPPSDEPLFG